MDEETEKRLDDYEVIEEELVENSLDEFEEDVISETSESTIVQTDDAALAAVASVAADSATFENVPSNDKFIDSNNAVSVDTDASFPSNKSTLISEESSNSSDNLSLENAAPPATKKDETTVPGEVSSGSTTGSLDENDMDVDDSLIDEMDVSDVSSSFAENESSESKTPSPRKKPKRRLPSQPIMIGYRKRRKALGRRLEIAGGGELTKSSVETLSDAPQGFETESSVEESTVKLNPSSFSEESVLLETNKASPVLRKYSGSYSEVTCADKYCWICHKDGGPMLKCIACPRVYHLKCHVFFEAVQDPSDFHCPECSAILKSDNVNTRSPIMQTLNLDQLCTLLKHIISILKLQKDAHYFMGPVDTKEFPRYREYVVYPMDISVLERNCNNKVYGCTEAFLADVKWIVHNSIVFNSNAAKITTVAKNLLKICKKEIVEVELCAECYYNSLVRKDSWFTEVCKKPHILIWARLKGYPPWPAKAMRCKDDKVDCRFFGAHDRARVPVKDCYLYSKMAPQSTKIKKGGQLEFGMQEIEKYIEKLKEKYGTFIYPAARIPYIPEQEAIQLNQMLPNYSSNSSTSVRTGAERVQGKMKPQVLFESNQRKSSSVVDENVVAATAAQKETTQVKNESRDEAAITDREDPVPSVAAAVTTNDGGEESDNSSSAVKTSSDEDGGGSLSLSLSSSTEKQETLTVTECVTTTDVEEKSATEISVTRRKSSSSEETLKSEESTTVPSFAEKEETASAGSVPSSSPPPPPPPPPPSAPPSQPTKMSPNNEQRKEVALTSAPVPATTVGVVARKLVSVKKIETINASVPEEKLPELTVDLKKMNRCEISELMKVYAKTSSSTDTSKTLPATESVLCPRPTTITTTATAVPPSAAALISRLKEKNETAIAITPKNNASELAAIRVADGRRASSEKAIIAKATVNSDKNSDGGGGAAATIFVRKDTQHKLSATTNATNVETTEFSLDRVKEEPVEDGSDMETDLRNEMVASKRELDIRSTPPMPAPLLKPPSSSSSELNYRKRSYQEEEKQHDEHKKSRAEMNCRTVNITENVTLSVINQANSAASAAAATAVAAAAVSPSSAAAAAAVSVDTTNRSGLTITKHKVAKPVSGMAASVAAVAAVTAAGTRMSMGESPQLNEYNAANRVVTKIMKSVSPNVSVSAASSMAVGGKQQPTPPNTKFIPSNSKMRNGVVNGAVPPKTGVRVIPSMKSAPKAQECQSSFVCDIIDESLYDGKDHLRKYVETFLDKCASRGDLRAKVILLQKEIETLKKSHELLMDEIKRDYEVQIAELRAASIAQKKFDLASERLKFEQEKERAVKEAKSKQWCSNCQKIANYYCCWNTAYCDFECQKDHWNQHMHVCKNDVKKKAAESSENEPPRIMMQNEATNNYGLLNGFEKPAAAAFTFQNSNSNITARSSVSSRMTNKNFNSSGSKSTPRPLLPRATATVTCTPSLSSSSTLVGSSLTNTTFKDNSYQNTPLRSTMLGSVSVHPYTRPTQQTQQQPYHK